MSNGRQHTHTGHCQVCGRTQAVLRQGPGEGFSTGNLAKHGYKVAGFGFFAGVCTGSGEQALQLQHVITDDIVIRLTKYAANQLTAMAKLQSGEVIPEQVLVGNDRKVVNGRMTYVDRYSTWEEASVYHREAQVKREIYTHENNAVNAKNHVTFLIKLKTRIYGTPLIPVKKEQPIEIKQGLRFNNSNGDTFEVIKQFNNRYWRCVKLQKSTDVVPTAEPVKSHYFTVSNVTIRSYVKAERNKAESVT